MAASSAAPVAPPQCAQAVVRVSGRACCVPAVAGLTADVELVDSSRHDRFFLLQPYPGLHYASFGGPSFWCLRRPMAAVTQALSETTVYATPPPLPPQVPRCCKSHSVHLSVSNRRMFCMISQRRRLKRRTRMQRLCSCRRSRPRC